MEHLSQTFNAVVTKAKDTLEEINKNLTERRDNKRLNHDDYESMLPAFQALLKQKKAFPIFYEVIDQNTLSRDGESVRLVPIKLVPLSLEDALKRLELPFDTDKNNVLVLAGLPDVVHSDVFVPWSSKTKPLPLITRGPPSFNYCCVKLRIIIVHNQLTVDKAVLQESFETVDAAPSRRLDHLQVSSSDDELEQIEKGLGEGSSSGSKSHSFIKIVTSGGEPASSNVTNGSISSAKARGEPLDEETEEDDLLLSDTEKSPIALADNDRCLAATNLVLDDALRLKMRLWSKGSDGQCKDIRTLLSSLHTVAPSSVDWSSPSIGQLMIDPSATKSFYRRAILAFHPDRHQRAAEGHKFVTDTIFDALHQAYEIDKKAEHGK